MSDVMTEIVGRVGLITLNRARALNALTLGMIRDLTGTLLRWRDDPQVLAVAVRGMGRDGPFGVFCAGGDIRFFHRAALSGDPELEDFFTEEYTLNHLISTFPKPYLAFMDGIVMGGGMGLCQGSALMGQADRAATVVGPPGSRGRQGGVLRLVSERTRMAMPETHIGLFPDVGGGYFLSRCPGRLGEYLALTGQSLGGADAVAAGLADRCVDASRMPHWWAMLGATPFESAAAIEDWIATEIIASGGRPTLEEGQINAFFGLDSVPAIVHSLETAPGEWARSTAAVLRKRSPLMLHVVLEQVRRARTMGLADELRMERDLVRHCFNTVHLGRRGASSETTEGVRALAVDKDHSPKWNPPRVEDVTPDMVAPFFASPWPAHAHPLRGLR